VTDGAPQRVPVNNLHKVFAASEHDQSYSATSRASFLHRQLSMENDFDLIVVGSGAGGGTLASQLALAGARVLVLERGPARRDTARDEQSTLIEKRPYDERSFAFNDQPRRLYMGSGVGGSTSLYGAALLRPAPDDFHPGRSYGSRLDRSVWDWPISYEQLAPYYRQAEQLYHVAADNRDDSSPIPASSVRTRDSPLPLAPINQQVLTRCRQAGLNPFRLPLAIQADDCLRCSHCAGFTCPTGARRDAATLLQQAPVTILSHRDVIRIVRKGRRVEYVEVKNLQSGRLEYYRGDRYVVAAGAVGTPCILQRSGLEHPVLGRNYMMHYSPLVAGIFTWSTQAHASFIKQIGFADFYFGTSELKEKMGLVQSLPAPGPLMLKKSGLRFIPKVLLNQLRRHLLPFVGIVEDLPNPQNTVSLRERGSVEIAHQFSRYDRMRGAALTRAMQAMLRTAGAIRTVAKEIPAAEHVAHQCGTARFGKDPKHAVVDQDCRLFQQPDVFVVDGSILPTSLGVGPSLMLMANALRVCDVLKREIRCAAGAVVPEGVTSSP
jgi:choline dehydrogenase-like flavoprotein